MRNEIIILPKRAFHVDWKGLWEYQDLLLLFVKREFTVNVRQTILGPSWIILYPLLTSLVFMGVFHYGVRIPTAGGCPLLFYYSGLLLWNFFSQSAEAISVCLRTNANLFQKVYFPRLIVPLSILIWKLACFGLQLAAFVLLSLGLKIFGLSHAGWRPDILLFGLPYVLFQSAILALGLGLGVAAISVKYRDLQQVVHLGMQLWMYVTPIIYSTDSLSSPWKLLVWFNPMTPMIEWMRIAMLGTGVLDGRQVMLSAAITLLVFGTGLFTLKRVEQTFVDTI